MCDSRILKNSETDETTLRSYFESKITENKFKLTPDSTVNSIFSQYLNQPHLKRSKDPLSFWEANRLIFPELHEMNLK